jgi:hypothetical protein
MGYWGAQAAYGRWMLQKWLGWGAILIVGLILMGIFHKSDQPSGSGAQDTTKISNSNTNLTLAYFEQLNVGMSRSEVEELLGEGKQVSTTDSTFSLRWQSGDAAIRVIFKDNVLWKKSSRGLVKR